MAFLVEALLGPEAELTETDLKKLMVATREYSEMLDWVESTISTESYMGKSTLKIDR